MAQERVSEWKVEHNRILNRYFEMALEENRSLVEKIFKSEAAFKAWFFKHNHFKSESGQDCAKNDYSGQFIHKGESIVLPVGFEFQDKTQAICVTKDKVVPPIPLSAKPPEPAMDVAMAPPPPAMVPPAGLREFGPVEHARQSTESQDGPVWRPGSEMHALETYARSGVNPDFTRRYYALESVAARWSVRATGETGQVGRKVNGNDASDYLQEGKYLLGENPQTRLDDGDKRRFAATGHDRGTLVNALVSDQARQRVFVSGHVANIAPDGSLVRADHMPIELAHHYKGGNDYAMTVGPIMIPLGNMLGLPVGAAHINPQHQEVLPAEVRRWGIGQAVNAFSKLNESGFNTVFRDEQAKITSPFETPDRIYAKMYLDNATNVLNASVAQIEKDPKAPGAQEAAVKALAAWRDMGRNALIDRVDAMRIPMEEGRKGIEAHLTSLGFDVTALRAQADRLPPLQIKDMPQDLLSSLQDYKSLKDSRYAGITPGQTNAAYGAAAQYAYRTQNSFERQLARGEAPDLAEKDLNATVRSGLMGIAQNPASVQAFGQAVANNNRLGLAVGQALADIDRNYKNYGFKDHDEARAFTGQFVQDGDKVDREQLYRRGGTTPLPFIGHDGAYANTRPDLVAPLVGAAIQKNPALGAKLLDIVSNPQLGVDSHGKTDGRRYGTAFAREFAAEMVPSGVNGGAVPLNYAQVASTLDAKGKQQFHDAALASLAYGESGASGVTSRGKQRLDNLYTAAQVASTGGAVIGGADQASQRQALLASGKPGETITAFNSGAFDPAQIAQAARKGDAAAMYDILYNGADARAGGGSQAAVLGFKAHPALARDAVLLTMLREPNALNDAIVSLRGLDRSAQRDRFGQLADALEGTRDAAAKYKATGNPKDLESAVQHYGKFFSKMASQDDKNPGIKRFNALTDGLIDSIGQSPVMSAWVVDTVHHNPQLMQGVLAATTDTLQSLDNSRATIHGRAGRGDHIVPNLTADDVYQAQLFSVQTDKHGHAKSGKVAINEGVLASALASIPGAAPAGVLTGHDKHGKPIAASSPQGTPSQGAPASSTPAGKSQTPTLGVSGAKSPVPPGVEVPSLKGVSLTSVELGHALNTNPRILIGGAPGQSPEAALASWMEAGKFPLPAGTTYAQAAKTSIDAGLVTIAGKPGELVATPISGGLESTINGAGHLPGAAGIAKSWLLVPLLFHGGKHDTPLNGGVVPNCTNPLTCTRDPSFPVIPGVTPPGTPSTPGLPGRVG